MRTFIIGALWGGGVIAGAGIVYFAGLSAIITVHWLIERSRY